jgi:hypothetical protein
MPEAVVAEQQNNLQPDPAAVELQPEPEAEVKPVAEPEPPEQTPWYLKRISEETDAKQRAIEQLRAAEKRAADAEALAARMQSQTPAVAQQQAPQQAPRPGDSDFEMRVRQEAAQRRLFEDSTEVRNKGMAQYGAAVFQGIVNTLQATGATSDEFVADLIAVSRDRAHEIMEQLAKEPERAVALASMPSRSRIAELTRMSIAPAAPAKVEPTGAKPGISKAPAPAPRVESGSSQAKDWRSDDASEEEFDRGWRENMKSRSRRR